MQYTDIYIKKQDLSLNLYYKHYICDTDSDLKHKVILLFAAVILIVIATIIKNNKEVIKEDLKNNSILPLDYHYFYYGNSEGPKWLAIKDNTNVLGPGLIKRTNKTQEEFPEVYQILPPEGQVNGFMEWSFLDEKGNETGYPSFDVFLGYSARSREAGVTPNLFYLYKDLTAHYKSKYPEAGIKAVVVSYTLEIN